MVSMCFIFVSSVEFEFFIGNIITLRAPKVNSSFKISLTKKEGIVIMKAEKCVGGKNMADFGIYEHVVTREAGRGSRLGKALLWGILLLGIVGLLWLGLTLKLFPLFLGIVH